MASQTSALPDGSTLTKPAYTDSADIAVINTNMDKIVSNINAENQALSNVNNALSGADIINNQSDKDLNHYITTKAWRIGNISQLTNGPVWTLAGATGDLYVRANGTYISQLFIGNAGLASRLSADGGSTWNDWEGYATKSDVLFKVGDTFALNGAQVNFRTLSDKTEIYFTYYLPNECASGVNSFTLSVVSSSPIWFSNGSIGAVSQGAQAHNIALRNRKVVTFSLPVTGTIQNAGFGICELNANITFTA